MKSKKEILEIITELDTIIFTCRSTLLYEDDIKIRDLLIASISQREILNLILNRITINNSNERIIANDIKRLNKKIIKKNDSDLLECKKAISRMGNCVF